jgi:WD40 repeat protein
MLLSPDGQTALTGLHVHTLRLWDTATGQPRGGAIECPLPILDYSISPDWKLMPVIDKSNQVTIWDLTTGRVLRTVPGLAAGTNDVTISPDGKLLALSSPGGAIRIWDIEKEAEVRAMQGIKAKYFSLHFSPDGTRLVSAAKFRPRGEVIVLDVATGRELLDVPFEDMQITSHHVSADGKRLAVAGSVFRYGTGEVRILDFASGQAVLPPLKGHTGSVMSVAFSPDGQRLATSGIDAVVKIWDLATGQEVSNLKGHTAMVNSLVFVSGGRRLMGAATDGTVRVWDATPVPE